MVTLYYPPDTASTGRWLHELCSGLAENGTTVHVIAGQPSYTGNVEKSPVSELMDGVHVHRVSTLTASGRSNLPMRFVSYSGFMVKAWFRAVAIARKEQIDSIVTVSNPPTVGLIGRRVARKLNIPFHYILFDIHPDAVGLAGTIRLPPGVGALWRWMNRRIWNAATTIAVPGHYMQMHLTRIHGLASNKVNVLPLWATPELSESEPVPSPREKLGFRDDSLLIIHAGNIGLMHRINDLIDAVGSLEHLNIEMAVAGDGVSLESAKNHVRSNNYNNIRFLGYVDDSMFEALLQSADIAATTLVTGMEKVSVPSRSLTFMSAGLPLFSIMSQSSDIGDLVVDEQCGWVAQSSHQAAQILTELASDRARVAAAATNAARTYADRFTRASGIDRYSQMITRPPEDRGL